MFVRLCGVVGAGVDQASVRAAPGAVAQGVLAAIALAAGRLTSPEQVAEAVWDDPPATWRNALHVAISRLRDTLGRDAVITVAGWYRLDAALARIDLIEIDELLTEARRLAGLPRWPEVLQASEALLALATQTPLTGLRSDWAEGIRTRFGEQLFAAGLLRARALVALGRPAEAVDLLAQLARQNALDEAVALNWMQALVACGRAPEALSVYDALRHRLADELGVDPSSDTQRAYLALLNPEPPKPFVPARVVRVPRPAGPTWGREETVATICDLLNGGYPLVTVVGPGGIGKTRVAVSVARRWADDTGSSAWFVDLAAASEEAEVLAAVDAAIDPTSADHASLLGVGSHLVVLDNVEHLVGVVADLAERLLGLGEVVVLVTSRVPLKVATERLHWLAELDHGTESSPATLMLAARAATWMTPGAGQLPVLAALAARVDGVPLALELVAAALRWHSPEELLADLVDVVRTPAPGQGRAERQLSVTAAIEWNLGQADEATRRALGALLVLTGDFPLSAGERVLAAAVPEQPARQLLTALIDLSLVQRSAETGTIRLRILEPVRLAVAGHPCVPAAETTANDAAARFFLGRMVVAVEALDESDTALVSLHHRDDHNLTTALEWLWDNDRAAALDGLGHMLYYWRVLSRAEQIDTWWARVRDEADVESAAGARCAIAVADSFCWRSRPDGAHQARAVAARHLAALDRRWLFIWTIVEADLLRLSEDFEAAEAVLDHGPAPITRREASTLASLRGSIAAYAGDFEGATRITDEILDGRLGADQLSHRVLHLTNRAYTAITAGDLDLADRLLVEAMALARATGILDDFLMANNNVAWVQLDRDEPAAALQTVMASVEAIGRPDDLLMSCEMVLIAALALERAGRLSECARVVGLLRELMAGSSGAIFDPWAEAQAEGLLSRQPPAWGRDGELCFENLGALLRRTPG